MVEGVKKEADLNCHESLWTFPKEEDKGYQGGVSEIRLYFEKSNDRKIGKRNLRTLWE